MLFWLDFDQTQSNLYKWFRMQRHDMSSTSPKEHVTPLFISLHWLPVAARIQFKTLMVAYRTTTGSAPTYFHSLMTIYIPSRSLRSASERRLVVPSQRGSKSLSRTFSFTVPGRWNDLPPHPDRWIPVNLQATTEHSSLSTVLDFIINFHKKKHCLSLYLILLLLACTYLNNDWDLVLRALPLSVCLFKFVNCKSLWITASAKWQNVNDQGGKSSRLQCVKLPGHQTAKTALSFHYASIDYFAAA